MTINLRGILTLNEFYWVQQKNLEQISNIHDFKTRKTFKPQNKTIF